MAKKKPAAKPAAARPKAPPNPAALTTPQLLEVLAAAGHRASAEDIAADVAAGAPTNPGGTLHLVHYTAWLAAQEA
jgi:hypothetical protein